MTPRRAKTGFSYGARRQPSMAVIVIQCWQCIGPIGYRVGIAEADNGLTPIIEESGGQSWAVCFGAVAWRGLGESSSACLSPNRQNFRHSPAQPKTTMSTLSRLVCVVGQRSYGNSRRS